MVPYENFEVSQAVTSHQPESNSPKQGPVGVGRDMIDRPA